ncbi:hypothetical protein, partial [Desulfovibrio sp.]|uniref:hypothetical protein n=1 Tax=Desulfovibrio sp. TaxID=885 RepID=UPI003AB70B84
HPPAGGLLFCPADSRQAGERPALFLSGKELPYFPLSGMICWYPENDIMPFFMLDGPDSGQRPFPGDRPPLCLPRFPQPVSIALRR